MRIVLTEHCKESFRLRLPCHPSKYLKLARKAWNSTERIRDGEISNRMVYEREVHAGRNVVYRKLLGRIFIFEVYPGVAVLVTLTPNALSRARARARYAAFKRREPGEATPPKTYPGKL